MKSLRAVRCLLAAAVLCLSSPLLAAIQLVPVVSSGLSSPVFAGNAGDGSNRLFIVEQGGGVRVLQPGSSTPTAFLDLHTKVVAGNEQGLLGLAFHPQYAANGRFFVYYTRAGDGTIVIAEYKVSGNPNVADPAETVLLTIPHPVNTNHNGGMLAFGPDGYLYVGVGDGGGGNDLPNNAQNLDLLLGKILRIDVSVPLTYSSPPTNPFHGATPGRDEIFAYGMRNPWRFSFDRITGAQWVADVGQGAREEVDTPIVSGGNYGWRVFEGSACTNNDPALCGSPQNYVFPVFDYLHAGGRCSITGGYVYRGAQGAVPGGTYLYGDYCSGEILMWDGTTQSVLLDTQQNISSFGEDEQGELYVVNLGGTVSKIAATTACTYGIAPASEIVVAGGASGNVAVTAGAGCAWTAVSGAPWVHVTSGSSGSGNGNVGYSVDANASPSPRSGTMTVAGQTFTVNQVGAAIPIQHGLSGSWYQPATSGEGIELEVSPNLVAPGIGLLVGSWLTFTAPGSWDYGYDTSASGQRWYWFSGIATEGAASATLTLYQNLGGNFNALPVTSAERVGTVELSFSNCSTARMAYALDDESGASGDRTSGTISLIRLMPNVTCTVSGASMADADFGYSGNWFDPVTAGQGFFFEVNPKAATMFLVWQTYAPEGQSEIGYRQRWYTGLANATPGLRTLPMTLYQTTGGLRDGGGGVTAPVGTATATLFSCDSARLEFSFFGGSSNGVSGTIDLSRVGPTPAGCGP